MHLHPKLTRPPLPETCREKSHHLFPFSASPLAVGQHQHFVVCRTGHSHRRLVKPASHHDAGSVPRTTTLSEVIGRLAESIKCRCCAFCMRRSGNRLYCSHFQPVVLFRNPTSRLSDRWLVTGPHIVRMYGVRSSHAVIWGWRSPSPIVCFAYSPWLCLSFLCLLPPACTLTSILLQGRPVLVFDLYDLYSVLRTNYNIGP